jgi:LemA protein
MSKRFLSVVALLVAALALGGCGYNTLQSQDEQITAAWSEVVNQYQRRADLVPNLVNVVKGAAAQERDVLREVTEARARATSIQATPELLENPEAFKQFQQAQGELSGALSRLLVTVERYPELRSIAAFRDLQAQLEGVENRIAVARKRYIESVQAFNTTVRRFPSNITANVFGFDTKPNFTVENERAISTAPTVDFGGDSQTPSPPQADPQPQPEQ